MTKPFKEFLTTLINQNYISVFNDESGSEYTIPASELAAVLIDPRTLNTPSYNPEELEAGDFFLSCEYFVDGSMPYGLYTLVRFVSAFTFAYLSYDYFKSKKEGLGFVFAALALLFQPFFKVALGRTIWNIVDVIVSVGLLYLLISTFKRKR